jgi:hypothetical protein
VGWTQRQAILKLVRSLSPQVIHTSNNAYRSVAFEKGIAAELLPMCGNIPLAGDVDPRWLEAQAGTLGAPVPVRDQAWWFGLFGTLHPEWSPEPLFSYLAEAAERVGRHVVIGAIGRLGRGETTWRELQERYSPRFSFVTLGERGPRDVSAFLQGIDFGIATTPWEIIGKSGTAAAMLEHGLPVIVSRDDVHYGLAPDVAHDPLLRKMGPDLPRWLIEVPARRAPARSRHAEMVETFLADLQAVEGLPARSAQGLDVRHQLSTSL